MKNTPWMMIITEGLLALTLILSAFSPFESPSILDRETMERSNQMYEKGRFQEAVQTYEQLVEKGIEDASLFYNLGNAHYKAGDLGRAILNYERARRLAPREADILANLEYTRSKALDRYESEAVSPLKGWVHLASSYLTLNELSLVALGSFWLIAILILVYRHSRSGRMRSVVQAALILVVLLFGVSAFTLGTRVYLESNSPGAIIVTDSVEILSGPGEDYITEFSLHAGAQVIIQETRGQWVRVALPGEEFQGWAPLETVERIG